MLLCFFEMVTSVTPPIFSFFATMRPSVVKLSARVLAHDHFGNCISRASPRNHYGSSSHALK